MPNKADTSQSRIHMVRVKTPHSDHLIAKAIANPANPHNHVATEINTLIKADFEKAQRARIKKK